MRDLYYVVNKLAARRVKLSSEARTLVADCNVLLLHSKDVSSYIDPRKQFNQKWRVSKFSFCNRAYLKYLSSLPENRGHKKMIVWLKLISSGLIDSLIQVSVLIFSSFFRPPWLGSFAEIAECFPRLRAQYDLEQAPWTGNQAAWHSLEVSRTLSPASHKFLCICKLLHHEFAGERRAVFVNKWRNHMNL